MGVLAGAPIPTQAPRLAVWDDPKSGTLDARARAWLEINCAHCHSPDGPGAQLGARPAGLAAKPDVLRHQQAAGGRRHRLGRAGLTTSSPASPTNRSWPTGSPRPIPGVMMPELGKRLVHEEGVALVREWIAAMAAPAR